MLIGDTRFSTFMPNYAGLGLSRLELDDYKKKLFSEDRLDFRAKIFGEVSLPSLSAIKEYINDYKVLKNETYVKSENNYEFFF
jgi:hypothetical protein